MEPPAPQPGRPLDRSNVAAVIPAYHEEAHVRRVAERTRANSIMSSSLTTARPTRPRPARAKAAQKSSCTR